MQTDRGRILDYYANTAEWDRLESAAGAVEFARALQLLEQYLDKPCRVLDLGGGPGRYAIELARRRHRVVLADLSPDLLKEARERISDAGVRDQVEGIDEVRAEDLSCYGSSSFDAVVAFGPFYHLVERSERAQAASEIYRVLRDNGLAFVAFVPRLTAVAALVERAASAPEQVAPGCIRRVVETGIFRNASPAGFQEGYYPQVGELEDLLMQHGFGVLTTLSLRSIAYGRERELYALKEDLRAEVDEVLGALCTAPEVVAMSGHAVVVARRKT